MIAMALACDPLLLIADEPTTALDVMVQAQVLRLLADIKRDRGLAMMFITHDLSVLSSVADRLAVMYAGRFVEEGPATEMLRSTDASVHRGARGGVPDDRRSAVEAAPEASPGDPPDPERAAERVHLPSPLPVRRRRVSATSPSSSAPFPPDGERVRARRTSAGGGQRHGRERRWPARRGRNDVAG